MIRNNAIHQAINNYGHYAAGRLAEKVGVPFEDFYYEVFGIYPKPVVGLHEETHHAVN